MSLFLLNRQERKVVTLAAVGGMLEFYDFIIYGIFSVYFAHQFFPSNNLFIVVIQSYLIFVLGYFARPIGGIVFSHIGDEYGRKIVLIITIALMGAASVGIGILPTYAQIGIAAPITLLILRLLQGLALGGELPSTYVYIFESIVTKRGFALGVTMSFVNGGLLLGMLMNYGLNQLLTQEQLETFGWRLPFIFGGLICLISYQIRNTLQETNVFIQEHNRPKLPVIFLLKNQFLKVISGTGLIAVMSGFVVVVIVFMPTYLHDILKVDNQTVSYLMAILMGVNILTIYLTGRFTQTRTPFQVLSFLLFLSCVVIPLSYVLINHHYLLLGLVLLGFIQGISAMITPYVITSIFESKIRLTGVALCYNVGFTLFGGLAPLIITEGIRKGMNVYAMPALYLLVMVLICSLCAWYLKAEKAS